MSPAADGRGWQLTGANRSQGVFDAVVIAHNGKCANRLAAPSGAPAVARQLMRLKLNSIWALAVAFEAPVDAPFEGARVCVQQGAGHRWLLLFSPTAPAAAETSACSQKLLFIPHRGRQLHPTLSLAQTKTGAFVTGSPVLGWAANNTAKLGLTHPGFEGMQCWTLLSTAAYGR